MQNKNKQAESQRAKAMVTHISLVTSWVLVSSTTTEDKMNPVENLL